MHSSVTLQLPVAKRARTGEHQRDRLVAALRILRGPAILINHGSFNPVHRGHIEMMVAARRRLQSEGYSVIAAHLAITRPDHIFSKGLPAMHNDLRVQCIDILATELGETWIKGDARGLNFGSGGRMANALQKEGLGEDVTFFNVYGADLSEKYGMWYGCPAVWVGRTGSPLPEEGDGPTFCVESNGETAGFSSTKLRQALDSGDEELLRHIAGSNVASLLMERRSDLWI